MYSDSKVTRVGLGHSSFGSDHTTPFRTAQLQRTTTKFKGRLVEAPIKPVSGASAGPLGRPGVSSCRRRPGAASTRTAGPPSGGRGRGCSCPCRRRRRLRENEGCIGRSPQGGRASLPVLTGLKVPSLHVADPHGDGEGHAGSVGVQGHLQRGSGQGGGRRTEEWDVAAAKEGRLPPARQLSPRGEEGGLLEPQHGCHQLTLAKATSWFE